MMTSSVRYGFILNVWFEEERRDGDSRKIYKRGDSGFTYNYVTDVS